MSFLPKHITLFGIVFILMVSPALSEISLNNYGDPAYPDRCVLDVGSTVMLLSMGQGFQLKSLPCTNIICIGDGYGVLSTCEKETPPDGCFLGELINWDSEFPECCKRNIICD